MKNEVNGIDIPKDMDTVPKVLAYKRGYEDAQDLVQGGQGRDVAGMLFSAGVVLIALAVAGVGALVAMYLGR